MCVVGKKRASVVKVDTEDASSEHDPSWGEVSELQYQTVNKKCPPRGRRLRWNEGRQEPQRKNNKVLVESPHNMKDCNLLETQNTKTMENRVMDEIGKQLHIVQRSEM